MVLVVFDDIAFALVSSGIEHTRRGAAYLLGRVSIGVVGARIVKGKMHAQTFQGTRLVAWYLHPLGMHSVIGRSLADTFGRSLHPFGTDVAQSLAAAYLLDKLEHRLGVAVFENKAVCVLDGENALFKQLVGKADGVARADGIQTQLTAHEVCLHCRSEVGTSCGA